MVHDNMVTWRHNMATIDPWMAKRRGAHKVHVLFEKMCCRDCTRKWQEKLANEGGQLATCRYQPCRADFLLSAQASRSHGDQIESATRGRAVNSLRDAPSVSESVLVLVRLILGELAARQRIYSEAAVTGKLVNRGRSCATCHQRIHARAIRARPRGGSRPDRDKLKVDGGVGPGSVGEGVGVIGSTTQRVCLPC